MEEAFLVITVFLIIKDNLYIYRMKHDLDTILSKAKEGIGNLSLNQLRDLNIVKIPVQIELEQYIVIFKKVIKNDVPQWIYMRME